MSFMLQDLAANCLQMLTFLHQPGVILPHPTIAWHQGVGPAPVIIIIMIVTHLIALLEDWPHLGLYRLLTIISVCALVYHLRKEIRSRFWYTIFWIYRLLGIKWPFVKSNFTSNYKSLKLRGRDFNKHCINSSSIGSWSLFDQYWFLNPLVN